jgi:hypothetical protein
VPASASGISRAGIGLRKLPCHCSRPGGNRSWHTRLSQRS